jgi:hypothetical protein
MAAAGAVEDGERVVGLIAASSGGPRRDPEGEGAKWTPKTAQRLAHLAMARLQGRR